MSSLRVLTFSILVALWSTASAEDRFAVFSRPWSADADKIAAASLRADEATALAAIEALGTCKQNAAYRHLLEQVTNPRTPRLAAAACGVLDGFRSQCADDLAQLATAANSAEPQIRLAVVSLFQDLDDDACVGTLVARLADADNRVVTAARKALVVITGQDKGTDYTAWKKWQDDSDGAFRRFMEKAGPDLASEDPTTVTRMVMKVLQQEEHSSAVALILEPLLRHPNPEIARMVLNGLKNLRGATIEAVIQRFQERPSGTEAITPSSQGAAALIGPIAVPVLGPKTPERTASGLAAPGSVATSGVGTGVVILLFVVALVLIGAVVGVFLLMQRRKVLTAKPPGERTRRIQRNMKRMTFS